MLRKILHTILIVVSILSIATIAFVHKQRTYSKLDVRDMSDIQYLIDSDNMSIYTDLTAEQLQYISMQLQFDTQTVELLTKQIYTPHTIERLEVENGYLELVMKINPEYIAQALIELPYQGKNPFIVITQAQATDKQGSKNHLAIGAL
jgi:hypothetical protein